MNGMAHDTDQKKDTGGGVTANMPLAGDGAALSDHLPPEQAAARGNLHYQQQSGGKDAGGELPIKGRFARYVSPFLQLMIPLLGTRYLWLAVEDINPLNFLKKTPANASAAASAGSGVRGYLSRNSNFASLGMGATLFGIVAYYSKRTYDDMKTLYREAVGYELGKKPEEVGWSDLFLKSKNQALAVTRDAFVKRTIARFGSGAAFFVPWKILRKGDPSRYDVSINAGVGAAATYLSLDGYFRSPSYFDVQQKLVDTAINHVDANTYQRIDSKDIQSLLLLQRKHLDKHYQWPALVSPGGERQTALAARVADLLNQTYNNTPQTGHADFTIGKFNYLVGFGLLDSFPSSLAFVELANASRDMSEVKQAVAAISGGQDAQAVFQSFGIDMNALGKAVPKVSSIPARSFAAAIPQARNRLPTAPREPQDFATHAAATQLSI